MDEIPVENPCPPGHRLVRPVWGLLGLNVLAVLLLAVLVIRSGSRARAKVWEYKVEEITDNSFADRLSLLGKQGWEMVYARKEDDASSASGGYEVVFKREVE